jgi:signal transduction histidine kinase/serine/threonine protein kinase/tetratricopeptide (TPR) repeat protein
MLTTEFEFIKILLKDKKFDLILAEQKSDKTNYLLKITKKHSNRESSHLTKIITRELEFVSSMEHPNIAHPVRAVLTDDMQAILYDNRDGESFEKVIHSPNKIDPFDALNLVVQLLDALEHIHSQGLVHCDIHPNNLFINNNRSLEIIDFSMSISEDDIDSLQDGIVIGSFPYLSPEQTGFTEFKIDTRSDLYCTGLILYELLAGHLPFQVESLDLEVLLNVMLKTEMEPIRTVPVILNQILLKALHPTPSERYQTASGFKYDLKNAMLLLESEISVPFDVGERDAVISVNKSRRFISRDHELKILEIGLDQLKRGDYNAFLLLGASGIGKTEIVNKFRRKNKTQASFITIKCNRFTPNQPYSALHQIVRNILASFNENEIAKRDTIRRALQQRLPDESGIIYKVFPEMKEFFNRIELSGQIEKDKEADRINHVLALVMDILCDSLNQVVLCIDDIQWVDKISFDILMKMRKNKAKCMYVFTYRIEKEHHKSHLFNVPIGNIADRMVNVIPLRVDDIRTYIMSMFEGINELTLLTNLLIEKSNGNPLMLREVVNFLVENSTLKRIEGHWYFAPEMISDLPAKFDSLSLILHKFKNLNSIEQFFLQLASMIEGVLERQLIEQLGDFHHQLASEILKKLELEGFLIRNLNGDYSFAHDKVQEAILNSIEPSKKVVLYERLAEKYEKLIEQNRNHIFITADTYLKTSNLYKSFQLSFQAAHFAIDKIAFDVAIKQFRNCILIAEQMKKKGFATPVPISQIEIELADVLMLTGRNEQSLLIYKKAIENQFFKDHFSSLHIKYKIGCIYHNTGNFEKSIPYFIETLKELGVKFPETRGKLLWATIREVTLQLLHTITNCFYIRKKNKPDLFLKTRILNKLSYSLYFNDMLSCLYSHFKAMNLADNLVDSYEKAEAFTLHGPPSYQLFLKSRSFRYIKRAFNIAEKLNRKDIVAFSESFFGILYYFNAQWQKSEKNLRSSIRNLQSIGDSSSQIICSEHLWRIALIKGELQNAEQLINQTIKMSQEVNEQHFYLTAMAVNYYLQILKGNFPDVEKFNEIESMIQNVHSFLSQTHVGIYLARAELLINKIENAQSRVNSMLAIIDKKNINSEYNVPLYVIDTEIKLKMLENGKLPDKRDRKKIHEKIQKNLLILRVSSNIYPAYKGHFYRLTSGFHVLCNRYKKAECNYKKAMVAFHAYDMKYELARTQRDYGELLALMELPGFSRDNIDKAYILFESCGAVHESKLLKVKVSANLLKKHDTTDNNGTLITKENSNQIRFDTLLEFSSSMSQISEMSVLTEQILTSLIKATGAQYGCLLMKDTKGEMKRSLLRDFHGKDLGRDDVYISDEIIEKTEKHKQIVWVRNGQGDITTGKPGEGCKSRSVLCAPLFHENNYMGCVYLGNDRVAGLFSESAIKIAQILSTQASILLENAFLMQKYIQLNQELDSKIKQQTRDIVEKNKQLELANLKLVESERMKSILSGSLVHDIKNYAAGIEGNLQYLNRRLRDDIKIRRILDVVSETCTDIVSLASNLLDVAKMDEGKLVVHWEKLTGEYIACVAEKFLKNTLFEEKEITPVILYPQEQFTVDADIYLLERVFQNIFSNAAKYVPRSGMVELSFIISENELTLCFFNSGVPIPEKDRDILFEKYARLEKRQSHYSKGLGLFFCRMVMNAHHGRIWVESDTEGNYFKLAFPRTIAVTQIRLTGS